MLSYPILPGVDPQTPLAGDDSSSVGHGASWVWVDSSDVPPCPSSPAAAAPTESAPWCREKTLRDGLHRVLDALAPLPRAVKLCRREARPAAGERDALAAALGASSIARVPAAAGPTSRALFLDAYAPTTRALAGLEAILLGALQTKNLSFAAFGAATLLTEGWGGAPLWELSDETARRALRRTRAMLHPDKLEPALARALASDPVRREDLLGRARVLRQIYDILGHMAADPDLMWQAQAWAGVRAADISAFVRLHALGASVEPALVMLQEAWQEGWSSAPASLARALTARGLRAAGLCALVGVAAGVQAWRDGAARRGQLRKDARAQLASGIVATRRGCGCWAAAASAALYHAMLAGREVGRARPASPDPIDFAGELRGKEATRAARGAYDPVA